MLLVECSPYSLILTSRMAHWLLVTGYWLPATGYRLLVTGYWPLAPRVALHGPADPSSVRELVDHRDEICIHVAPHIWRRLRLDGGTKAAAVSEQ